jgi:hypothetical protein
MVCKVGTHQVYNATVVKWLWCQLYEIQYFESMGLILSLNNIFLFINKDNVTYSDSWDYSQQILVGVRLVGVQTDS